ncbi:MAG: lipopolysaccharide heptosyltransferase I [Rubrivivax sp.]|nr:lipopolysaccharide heptosyltransferase I [Rubrivivax sp.]MCL4696706.1 lipopolysaccharide heptosyltransferase I [Burkholderiaceae bacterium]
MRLLIVKTSSMGDVVHALPVVADVLRHHPGAQIEWLVETAFAAIPQLHPGVRRVLPMSWRKWRRALLSGPTWKAIGELRAELKREPYDLVLDMQGLLKSALWARQAQGPVAGYDRKSAREPAAAWFYQRRAAVGRDLHAVQRCRMLAASALGYPVPSDAPDFGLRAPAQGWGPKTPYAVLIPNASRKEKLWPERHWVSVGKRLHERGLVPIVLWGADSEQTLAERIAADCDGDVPPFLRVGEMAAVLAGAQQVVGLDTGFTHLAAAFGRPTIGIYCDHEPGLAGITGPGRVASIGGKWQVPSRNDVLALLEQQMG